MSYPKKSFVRSLVLACVVCFFSFSALANNDNSNPWSSIEEREFGKKEMIRTIVPNKFRTFKLDLSMLQEQLNEAPLRFSPASSTEEVILYLPMPDGEMQRFKIFDAPILEEALAAKFPMMHSYAGVGIDDPTASLRMDVTQFGFHGLVLSARHSSVYIDPYSKADTEHYISYYKNDFKNKDEDFACHLKTEIADDVNPDVDVNSNVNALLQGDCNLRTYKLALSSTGEYSQFHGGTTASVMAAMTTTMTRVNGIFERDVNVNMVIVSGNENLIFLDAGSDPYDNASASQLINECHTQCNAIIGNSNYDIGHVFSTGGGGLAGLGVVCNSNSKGKGVTGTNNPVGDPFDVDYVAHEIGHQFGANHTFNNSCSGNRNGSTAVEPGSGSSIMAYAGICPPNVQFNSDDYFHSMSIQEISNHITGSANSCANLTTTNNTAPVVDGGSDYILPIGTPFKLTATASDVDGDVITYCWEQMDNEVANMPPASTNTGGPAFRSYQPTEKNYRYFPKLNDIINAIDDNWEELTTVSRDMNFRVTVRDNHQGSGCTEEDDVNLTFAESAGPFLVQSPNTNALWMGGTNENITWEVAKTNQSPVNCANVDILLSTDGGFNYDMTLASQVPNTGSYSVTVPNIASTTCRVMVVCSDNIFFDISNTNFKIEESTNPTFVWSTSPTTQDVCGSVGSVDYQVDLTGLAGFNETVTLSTLGLPTNASASFSNNNFVPSAVSTLTLNNLENVANGTYIVFLVATSSSIVLEQPLTLIVNNLAPEVAVLSSPASGAMNQDTDVDLTWESIASATGYEIEIATSPLFGNEIIETVTVYNNTFTSQNLAPLTIYYWRVKAMNNCGAGDQSDWFSFQTGGSGCQVFESTDTPITLPVSSASTVVSSLNVDHSMTITSVKPTINITHSWVGDLKAFLTSPAGTSIELFDQVGVPASQYGCAGDNLLLTFDDAASSTSADLEGACGTGNYALEGTYQPIQNLSGLVAEDATGNWTLSVEDVLAQDGGSLNQWSVEICFNQTAETFSNFSNHVLNVEAGATENISNNYLNAISNISSTSEVEYLMIELPQNGSVYIDGVIADVGSMFTQEDIDLAKISYKNTNGSATTDQFKFNVSSEAGAWIQNEIFNINITTGAITASSIIEQQINCYNESTGMILVNATGNGSSLSYSLNGGTFQTSNLFANLSAGTYVVTVQDTDQNSVQTNAVVLVNPMEISATATVDGNVVSVSAAGGTGTLMYSINGVDFQVSNVFENLVNGTYTITVMDENECTVVTNTVNISTAAITASSVIEQSISCHNENDGIILVNATGNGSPFSYSLNGGAFQSSNLFTNLTAGAYIITVKDTDQNTVQTNQVELINPDELTATSNAVGNEVMVNAVGGTGNLMYNVNGGVFQNNNVFTNLQNGQFTFGVMDENGCQVEVSEAVNIVQSANVSTTNVLCHNEANGAITINSVSGGNAPYLYSLDNVNFSSNTEFANLTPGNYNIYIMDATGFALNVGSYQVNNAPTISVTANLMGNSIIAQGVGGVGTLMYSINGVDFQESKIFDNLPNGIYVVTVMDENGCTEMTNEFVIDITAINQLDFEISFEIFPNPNQGFFTLELNQETEENLKLQIFDVAGKLVQVIQLEKTDTEFKLEMDVTRLASGSYELLLTDGKVFGRKRFVKM